MSKIDVFKFEGRQLDIPDSLYLGSIEKLNDFDQNRPPSGSNINSQVLDLKTLPIFSPLKRGVIFLNVLAFSVVFHG